MSCSLYPPLKPPSRFLAPATSHHHGFLPIDKLSRTRTSDQKQQLALIPLQLSNRIIVQSNIPSAGDPSPDIDLTLFSLFQEIGIDERGTELILEHNLSLRARPFDSIRARIQFLQQIGINAFALGRLVLKRPDLLTAIEVDSLICFLRYDLESKIEPSQIERFLNTTDPRFFVDFEGKVKLLLHHGIPQDKIGHVLNNVNLSKALCLKSAEEIERTINFLKRFGGVELILRRPAILNYDMESQLIPRIGVLTELSGGDEVATGTVLRKLPAILAYSAEHLKDHIEFLRSFAGLTDQEIFKIVLVYPNLFSASRKRKLHPRIDFLKQCGLNSNEIFKFLTKAPLFVSLSFGENLAYKLVFLVKIGYENRTKDLAMAMGAVTRTSCKNLQEVIGLFLNHGLSCNDILTMSKKHPQILQYCHKSLEEKMDYLIDEMGREVGELLAFPAFLGYKLDDRIKHRYEVKRKILGEGMSINKLLSESAERFSLKKEEKKKSRTVL
ncbi:transcription termination factor MTERF8, chloroplastic-like [Actinidia eriantha]|uniref:transcription termination factor MTERF8, chloroplastic-like n=1 Tax=Actinidia eriantha TaxID=165200 RepID=UPI002586E7AA|nr:transcription termination factor MTERF8, chloroplastic-like [Actinidia eriantha]